MKLLKGLFLLLFAIVGVLTACASLAATSAPAVQPTGTIALVTEVPTRAAATGTSIPALESSPTTAPAAVAVSFANDILPILESRCVNCHGGDRLEEGLALKTYADLIKGSKDGAVVIPGDAGHSKLAELIINQKMPKRGPKLTPPQIQLIIDWINQGALEN